MQGSEFRNLLFNPKIDKYNLLAQLKRDNNYHSFQKKLNYALKHPFIKHAALAGSFPRALDEIRKKRLIPPTNNFEGEIAWLIYSIKQNKEAINKFLEMKNEYESSFIKSDFKSSETILNKIEADISISIWSIEQRFLLEEYKNGTSSNWKTLDEYFGKTREPIILLMLENLSKKAEEKISYHRYRDMFLDQIATAQGTLIFEYLSFRLCYAGSVGFKNFGFILGAEGNSSIVDKYLVLVDCLSEMITNFLIEDSIPEYFIDAVKELRSYVYDIRLEQIQLLLEPESITNLNGSKQLSDTLDEYLKGNYENVIHQCIKSIDENPQAVEYYELYVKASIENRTEISKSWESDIIGKLIKELHSFFDKRENLVISNASILKYALRFSSFTWGRQIYSLILDHTDHINSNRAYKTFFCINSKFINPRVIYAFQKKSQGLESAIRKFVKNDLNGLSLKTNTAILSGDNKQIQSLNLIDEKSAIYSGRALMNNKNCEEASKIFSSIIQSGIFSRYTIEESIFLLFKSYNLERKYAEAAKLYVEWYIEEQNFISRCDVAGLIHELNSRINNDELENRLEIGICFGLLSNDSYNTFISLDNYLSYIGINKPSQLLNKEFGNSISKKEIIFLNFVCVPEVLEYSIQFESTEEINQERIKILSFLIAQDSENETNYIKEVTEIQQKANIQRAIDEVNKARITVNIDQLKTTHSETYKEVFNRFLELEEFSKKENLRGYDLTSANIAKYLKAILEDSQSNTEKLKQDQSFVSFKVLYLELRDKYLFSKEFGLDGYLSTRIRHGSLENHIRSVFEKHNLISEKNSKGEYNDLEYIKKSIPLRIAHLEDDIQSLIKMFSKQIDDNISHLLNELIQVRTEKIVGKQNALFNYTVSNDYLWIIYNGFIGNIHNYEEFMDYTFTTLDALTDRYLEQIRSYINNDLRDLLIKLIDDLRASVDRVIGQGSYPELPTEISRCRTDILSELQTISEWFRLSNPSTEVTLDIETIIKTGVTITNSLYPNYKIDPKYTTGDSSIKLIGTVHLVYITRILLDNIIKHSELDPDRLEIEIRSDFKNDSTVFLTFTNSLSEKLNIEALKEKLGFVKAKWHDFESLENINIEGDSGFDKIRRILEFDMKSKSHGFDYAIDDRMLSITIEIDVHHGEI